MAEQPPPQPSRAPLDDPVLRGTLQEARTGRAAAARNGYLLENFPWQRFPANCGRWRRVPDPGALCSTVSSSWLCTKWVWEPAMSPLLLLDPVTRAPIAEHWIYAATGRELVTPDTREVWFAGDPRVCGMLTPAGDGQRAVFAARRGLHKRFTPAELAAVLGNPPATAPPAHREWRDGPWLADHPEPPPGQRNTLSERLGTLFHL